MKEAIEFVKHGVLSRKYDEPLSEIHFYSDKVQSFNGKVCMTYPIEDIGTFSVSSTKIISALKACGYNPHINLTEKNVILKRNKFRAMLPYEKSIPEQKFIKGEKVKLKEGFMDKVRQLMPFMSEDASRVWSQSILCRDGYMYVTNNIVAVRTKFKVGLNVTLPVELVSVLVKIDDTPVKLVVTDKRIGVKYANGSWVMSVPNLDEWPGIDQVFDYKFKKLPVIDSALKEAIETIKDFVVDDIIKITDNTLETEMSTIDGIEAGDCAVSSVNLAKVCKHFTHADFSLYPGTMPLRGDGIQGILAGIMV